MEILSEFLNTQINESSFNPDDVFSSLYEFLYDNNINAGDFEYAAAALMNDIHSNYIDIMKSSDSKIGKSVKAFIKQGIEEYLSNHPEEKEHYEG